MGGLDNSYVDSKVGIITSDPILIKDDLDKKHIPYFLLYGDESKSGVETCFVTSKPLGEELFYDIRHHPNTQGFAYLRDGFEFSKYIAENTVGRVAEIFKTNLPPDVMDDVMRYINLLPEDVSKELKMYFRS
ncbi:MAG: hypothetical protein KAI18_02435 [Candidatus Aenigmarchaeota archaeon]|nr:hypothetical protein [Candidatus Aenigmarchaeota archaeon]